MKRVFWITSRSGLRLYETLLTNNPIWIERTRGIGVILTAEDAIAYGMASPGQVAAGLRRRFGLAEGIKPYSSLRGVRLRYRGRNLVGDVYERYRVRIEELAAVAAELRIRLGRTR